MQNDSERQNWNYFDLMWSGLNSSSMFEKLEYILIVLVAAEFHLNIQALNLGKCFNINICFLICIKCCIA